MASTRQPRPAAQVERFGMRLLTRAGGLPVVKNNPGVRKAVERVLYVTTREGARAGQTVARRTYAARRGSGRPVRPAAGTSAGLFDLTPTDEQSMIRDVVRELAEEVLRPAGGCADEERSVSDDVRAAAAQLGLVGVGVPTELGGIAEESSATTGVLVLEELARGDMGIATSLMAPASVATALAVFGDSDQQATYLPSFVGDQPPAAAGLALMEPHPLADPLEPRTSGLRDGDEIVIDGEKALLANAAEAELFIVSARIDGEPRLVVIEPGTPGLSAMDDPAMGLRAAATSRLRLDGVRVPVSQLLGNADDLRSAVRRSRLAWSAMAVGTAQACLDQLVPYVKERHAFGEPIAHRQAVAFTISDIAIELAGLRLVVWRAASRIDQGLDAAQEVARARRLTATYASTIGSDAVQLLGGHGFVKEHANERWYRDLRGAGLLDGTLLV